MIAAILFQIHDFCDGFFAILLVAELDRFFFLNMATFQNGRECFGINWNCYFVWGDCCFDSSQS